MWPLLGNRVFANITKLRIAMKSYWIKVDHIFSESSIIRYRKGYREHRWERPGKTEMEIRVALPQAKEALSPQKKEGKSKHSPLEPSQRVRSCWHLDFGMTACRPGAGSLKALTRPRLPDCLASPTTVMTCDTSNTEWTSSKEREPGLFNSVIVGTVIPERKTGRH